MPPSPELQQADSDDKSSSSKSLRKHSQKGGSRSTPKTSDDKPQQRRSRKSLSTTPSDPSSYRQKSIPLSSSYPRSGETYDPHWDPATIQDCLDNGTVIKAFIRFNANDRSQAYCTIPGLPSDVFVKGYIYQNRAIEGDEVALQFLPPSEWYCQFSKQQQQQEIEVSASSKNEIPDDIVASPSLTMSASGGELNSTITGDENPFEVIEAVSSNTSTNNEKCETLKDVSSAHTCDSMVASVTEEMQSMELRVSASSNSQQAIATTSFTTTRTTSITTITSSRDDTTALYDIPTIATMLASNKQAYRVTAKVVGILTPSPRRHSVIGIVQKSESEGSQSWMFIPRDTRMPPAFVAENDIPPHLHRQICIDHHSSSSPSQAQEPQPPTIPLVAAYYFSWEDHCPSPCVQILKIIGAAGDLQAEITGLLDSNRVKDDDQFTPEILACLPDSPWSLTDDERACRRDFRSWCIFSIDPPTARDLDDALSVEVLENGLYRVGVHIADVSHFVQPHTALDVEAQERSTSVYLMDRVIPMLPRLLCEELCSLNPGVDRCALSIVFDMTEQGEIKDQWVGRSIICSCAKLSYPVVQDIIDAHENSHTASLSDTDTILKSPPSDVIVYGSHSWPTIAQNSLLLRKISQNLREKRFEVDGALRLDNIKLFFELDSDSGMPIKHGVYIQREANRLVEEFMLAANMAIARLIAGAFPERALLRCHPPPNEEKLKELSELASVLIPEMPAMDISSARGIQEWLNLCKHHLGDKSPMMDVMLLLCTKPMQLATYFSTGDFEGQPAAWRHYALAVSHYTHFTSPIRRYPDIIVHRLVMAALEKERNGGKQSMNDVDDDDSLGLFSKEKVSKIAHHANDRKLAAKSVQDNALKLYLAYLLMRQPCIYQGIVTGLGGYKYFDVYIAELGIDVKVHTNCLLAGGEQAFHGKWNKEERSLMMTRSSSMPYTSPDYSDIKNFAHLKNDQNINPIQFPLKICQLSRLPIVLGNKIVCDGSPAKIYAKIWME